MFEKRCDRCGEETVVTCVSFFNTEEICLSCQEAEQDHDEFERAVEAESEQVKQGNMNYGGIGLPPDLRA